MTDDPQLTQLISQPMPGNLSLRFQRQPSYLQACSQCGPDREVLVAESEGEILALCSHFRWTYWLQGRVRELWMVGDFRVKPKAALRSITGQGWSALRERLGDVPAFMSIVDDNITAQRLFSKARKNWPVLHPVTQIVTYILPLFATHRHSSLGMIQPSKEALVGYLNKDRGRQAFAPVLKDENFGREAPDIHSFVGMMDGSELSACGGLWFQDQYRQISVDSYAGWYGKLKSLSQKIRLNLLPPLGSKLSVAYASFMRSSDDRTRKGLLNHLGGIARGQGASFLVWGQNANQAFPLSPLRPRFAYRSTLYQLIWPGREASKLQAPYGNYEVAWL